MAEPVSKKIPQKSDRELSATLPFGVHGASSLPTVDVNSYNVELRERGKFIGDWANKGALYRLIQKRRTLARKGGGDPLGDAQTEELTKKDLENILIKGDVNAAGLVQAALDDFSEHLVKVIVRLRKAPEWKPVERIAIGGGFRGGRIGELTIGRTQVLLDEHKIPIELRPTRADPDDAGLIGAAHLVPSWIFAGYDGILAVDIGGSNIRCGVLQLKRTRSEAIPKVKVVESSIWEHADEDVGRTSAIGHLTAMLKKMIRRATKDRFRLAPFIGIGCPGRVRVDGAIDSGTQNLPGNWEAEQFNLPLHLRQNIRFVPNQETVVIMHNDAVVQGLSETPFMRDVRHWAVLTIGTGLGNAKFTNRFPVASDTRKKKAKKTASRNEQ